MEVISQEILNDWKHPIAANLLRQYDYKKNLVEIIENEASKLLLLLKTERPDIFDKQYNFIPIEKIVFALDINFLQIHDDNFDGLAEKRGESFQISVSLSKANYFRRRFSAAHELAHIILRQMVSPLTDREVLDASKFHYEEEALCNLFASSLLMPRESLILYLRAADKITVQLVDDIAGNFRVNRISVLRRIALLTNSILLLWKKTTNPLAKESSSVERLIRVYPSSPQLPYYIPLYCTPRDSRFSPNIIKESLLEGVSKSGKVKIAEFGSLPSAYYKTHNLFFKKRSKNLPYMEENNNPYDMATLIELQNSAATEF
jgi:Zn-dependent peptidase ImmA (M78 family)